MSYKPDSGSPVDQQQPEADSGVEEVLVRIPGAVVHLIDENESVELAFGDLDLVRLVQNGTIVAVMARIGHQIQWPLAKDEPAVKLDDSHYFFSLRLPSDSEDADIGTLNYGLTVPAEGQEQMVAQLDRVLAECTGFSVEEGRGERWWTMAEEGAPAKEKAAAYWTTVAPNVEDYSSRVARAIATGSGKVVRGILWCGDVTVERIHWGNQLLKRRMEAKYVCQVSPEAIGRIQRVKQVTKMSEEMALGILSGVVKVTGYVTSAIVNSKPGTKFFSILPGEIVLASLDGFNKVWDAVEAAGKNVMWTSSVVSTELVSERYGEHAGRATEEGLGAAGHAAGAAWALFKITKAINPKSVIKPTTLAKAKKQT